MPIFHGFKSVKTIIVLHFVLVIIRLIFSSVPPKPTLRQNMSLYLQTAMRLHGEQMEPVLHVSSFSDVSPEYFHMHFNINICSATSSSPHRSVSKHFHGHVQFLLHTKERFQRKPRVWAIPALTWVIMEGFEQLIKAQITSSRPDATDPLRFAYR